MMDYPKNGIETSYYSNAEREKTGYSTSHHTQKFVPDELKTYVKRTSSKLKKREKYHYNVGAGKGFVFCF